jgi:hypothetical protein
VGADNGLHRLDDVQVSGAAAQIAGERIAYLGVRRRAVRPQEAFRSHDHARRAISALHGALVDESLLQVVEPAVRLQPLDRRDLPALRLKGEDEARNDGLSVEEDGASAALAFATSFLESGEPESLSENFGQSLGRPDIPAPSASVYE